MNRQTGRSAALLLVLALSPALALAQSAPPGESRIEVGASFAEVIGTSTFSSTQTFKEYAEDGTFKGTYKVGKAPGGGFDLQYNLSPKFGVRLGAQTFSRKTDGTFDATVPHPFFFSRPRSVSGTESGLGFDEVGYSLTAVYRGGSGKWKVNLEGGPAYFSVKATVADKMSYGDVYPYDALTYGGVVSSKKTVSPIGFAVGLELGRELSTGITAVVQGRFSQGSGDLDIAGQKVNVKAGGAQARVGLRFVLARKK